MPVPESWLCPLQNNWSSGITGKFDSYSEDVGRKNAQIRTVRGPTTYQSKIITAPVQTVHLLFRSIKTDLEIQPLELFVNVTLQSQECELVK